MTSADKLTIETPEQTSLEFSLAGVGSRFVALAIDTLIQVCLGLLAFIATIIVESTLLDLGGSAWATAVFIILGFLLYYGYFAFFEAVWNGQTPGKRYTKIRVIKDSGHSITVFDAITRNLLRLVDQVPGIYAVGIVSALLSSQNKRLGDYAAGTVVVHERPFSEMQVAWQPSATSQAAVPVFHASRLSADELQLIEVFLQRRTHLAAEVRRQTAQQIADRLAARLGVAAEERLPDEEFLEALARERRNSVFR